MSSAASLKTRCPVCNRKYEVPLSAAGHKARCSECQTVFRVPVPPSADARPATSGGTAPQRTGANRNGSLTGAAPPAHPWPPTEDDILRWLSESDEDQNAPPPLPRGAKPASPAVTRPSTQPARDAKTAGSGTPADTVTPPIRLNDLRNDRQTRQSESPPSLRKTG